MIMTAVQLLERNSSPSRDEIRHALDGNLCRCTGYAHIVDAVEHAAKRGRM
jgi:aerobic-type carbon monoxide dehydrogenase small subunit (CoxS/CutS family)